MARRSISYIWKLSLVMGILLLMVGTWQPASFAGPVPAPILLVTNSTASNKFGSYLGEILRAEGLNSFDVTDISSLTSAALSQHDLTILAQTPLTSDQATTLTNYVAGGGRLLAMRPDAQIQGVFGLGAASGTLNNGYLGIVGNATFNGSAPGQGLTTATLQIHGSADQYSPLAGTATLAQLYSNATSATPYPAVVGFNYGTGQAIAFTYDLASNVIYTRQGNPANANVDTDSDGVVRTVDLFQTTGGGAPWVNRDRVPIPQADEQQRLFARLVQQLVSNVRPLPQLWYFPDTAKTMLILTGDAHANPLSYYQNEINSLNAHGGKISLYLSIGGDLTDASVQAWRAQGHEFGIHPYANKPDPYPPLNITSLAQGYDVYTNWFATTFSSPKSRTVRNHQVAWTGWTDAADLAVAHGIALDTSFYHWGPWLQKSDGTWPHGYITGSGQPMKFMRADGTLVPVYQQLTELVDEQLLGVVTDGAGFEQLNGAQAIAVSQQLIDSSLAGDYAALMTQFHVDYYGLGDPQVWAEGTLDYARSKGVPIWNADQWLSFVETRHDANYDSVAWNSSTGSLTFNLSASATSGITLTTMLPLAYGGRNLQSVTVDGVARSFSVQTIKGVNVAFVSVPAGNHNFSVAYPATTPMPTATNTATATPGPSPTPTNTPLPTSTPTSTPLPTATPVGPVTLFGVQTVGANQDYNPAGVAEAFQYTASASGTANQLSIYLDPSNAATQVVVGLYTNNASNNPGSLLSQATILNPVKGAWNTVTLPAANIVAGTQYWIAVLGPVGAGTARFRDVGSGSKAQTSSQSNLSTLPASWSAGATYSNSPLSAYAVQVAAPTATPANTATPTSTPTPLPPTNTPTALPPTNTPLPGPTSTSTPTSLPPTNTPTALPPTNTPLPTPTSTSTPTALPPTNTPSPTPTSIAPTPTPLSGSVTQITFSDFGQICTVLTNTHVSDIGGGAVTLAAVFADDFGGTALDATRWSSGNWSGGGYTPVISGSALMVQTAGGGWVRSLNTYTHGVIETIAQFDTGAWQHIGFASDGFAGNRYFIFSTYTGDGNLYARVNNNASEQRVSLGAIPTGMHRYRIEWSALDASNDQVSFYVDGVQLATINVTNVGAANFYLYFSNATATSALLVDAAQVTPPYLASGSYTSCALDAGVGNAWQTVSWSAGTPVNTSLAVQARTSLDGVTWSNWNNVLASGSAVSPVERYIQYGLLLATTDSQTTPQVNSVTLGWQQQP